MFAILKSGATRADKATVEKKLEILIRMAIEDALDIESL